MAEAPAPYRSEGDVDGPAGAEGPAAPFPDAGRCVEGACDGEGGGGGPGPGAGSMFGPAIADKRCIHCPSPELPPAFTRAAGRRELLAKVCVNVEGAVASASPLRGRGQGQWQRIDGPVAEKMLEVVRGWRYIPYLVDGRAVPFCYVLRLVFEVT